MLQLGGICKKYFLLENQQTPYVLLHLAHGYCHLFNIPLNIILNMLLIFCLMIC